MRFQAFGLLSLFCLSIPLGAAELAPPTVAKIIRVIAQASGVAKAACGDKEIAGELSGLGVGSDPDSKICWAASDKEVARFAAQHRLVICGNQDWLALGASVALTAEGGRPAIFLSVKNLGPTGITLPDSIVKISKVVK